MGAEVAIPAPPGGTTRWLKAPNTGGFVWSAIADTDVPSVPNLTRGAVYPETYNAVGDGVADDTLAVQSAATAAAAAGSTLILKAKYRCTGQIKMAAGLEIRLATPTAALIKDYTSGAGFTSSFLVSDSNATTKTGAITLGSAIVTGLGSTSGLVVGQLVTGASIPGSTTIQSVDSSTQVTLSQPVLATNAAASINFITKASGITIGGPGSVYASSTAMQGNIIGVYGDDFVFEDFRISCWAQGRAIVGVGDRWRGRRVKMTGSDGLTGSGGIRYEGGVDSVFSFLHIEAGDDCLQMVPAGSSTDPLFDQSISRCTYLGCTGYSTKARFICISLNSPTGPGGMTASVKDSQWIACRGGGNTRAVKIHNMDSSGDIDGITLQDCSIDTSSSSNVTLTGLGITSGSPVVTGVATDQLSIGLTVAGTGIPGGTTIVSIDTGTQITLSANATATNANASLTFGGFGQTIQLNRSAGSSSGVLYYAGVGAVKNIYLRRLTVTNPVGTSSTIGFAGVGFQNIYLEDCVIPASPNATTAVLNLLSTTTLRIRGGQIDAGGKSIVGIALGGTSAPCADCQVDATRIIGIANGQLGINFNAVAGGRMRGVRVEQFSGQTTAKGWKVAAASSGISIVGNDLSQLSNATKFTDLATDTEVYGNLGDTTAYGTPFAALTSPTFSGLVTAADYAASGLTGATAASRYVGATTSGAPTSGTFAVGDHVIDQTGTIWVCTSAGTPGTWAPIPRPRVLRSGAWAGLQVLKGTTQITAALVNKVFAITAPESLWGKTITAYGINQTIAPVTAGGKATAVTIRFALAKDVAGIPDTAIVTGSEATIDALTGAPTGGLASTAVSVVVPVGGWILFVVQPTGGDGTLTTYPTYDSNNGHVQGVGAQGATPPSGVTAGYSESGQTTTATMVGATLPAISSVQSSSPRALAKVS